VKIDLEKVYDRVNWDFLQTTLEDFGFPFGTMTLIMFCVRSSSLTLIWNGSKLPSFSLTCRLKQRDLIPLYLFVLCMEKLACLITKKVSEKTWQLIHILRGGPGISHFCG
jgi:hypothetical protein